MDAEIGVDTGAAAVSQEAVRQSDGVTLFASFVLSTREGHCIERSREQ
jgi:hypothetical protein